MGMGIGCGYGCLVVLFVGVSGWGWVGSLGCWGLCVGWDWLGVYFFVWGVGCGFHWGAWGGVLFVCDVRLGFGWGGCWSVFGCGLFWWWCGVRGWCVCWG